MAKLEEQDVASAVANEAEGDSDRIGLTPQVYRVTMRLSPADVDITTKLEKALDARSKADAISQALAVAWYIVERLQGGEEVLIRRPGSEVGDRLVLPKVRRTAPSTAAAAAG